MKKINLYFGTICSLLILFSVTAFTGCKKDDDPSNTEKLSDKNFKLTAFTFSPAVNINGVLVTDYYAQMQDCEKDNILRFDKAGTFTEDEGALKCEPLQAQTENGTWVWNTNETIISITYQGENTRSATVIKNDGTTFSASNTEVFNGVNYTVTRTYKVQ